MSRSLLMRQFGGIRCHCQVRPSLTRTTALLASRKSSAPRPSASFHTTSAQWRNKPPKLEETPPTDFRDLDILGNTPPPSTAIDHCLPTGFHLNSGTRITDGSGVLLVNGEAFKWRPWVAKGSMELVNKKGQFELPREAFGLLDLLWPRPDILVIGVGPRIMPLSPETKKHISDLGIRVEILDTRNAAAQFNLIATERGVNDVGAAMIPIGWKEGEGAVE